MNAQQIILSMVLATMVFSVALELRIEDFKRVAQTPKLSFADSSLNSYSYPLPLGWSHFG